MSPYVLNIEQINTKNNGQMYFKKNNLKNVEMKSKIIIIILGYQKHFKIIIVEKKPTNSMMHKYIFVFLITYKAI